MSWYLKALRNYAVFHGRARRKEYWYFVLINIIISVALAIVDSVTGTYNSDVGLGLLSGMYTLAVLVPGIAVSVRRLHDIGRSGWWLLVVLVPIVGAIVLFIFMVLDSKPEQNEYGPSPKYGAA
jgi:uncharacterized membrane protein YhaH (DUF805 family)